VTISCVMVEAVVRLLALYSGCNAKYAMYLLWLSLYLRHAEVKLLRHHVRVRTWFVKRSVRGVLVSFIVVPISVQTNQLRVVTPRTDIETAFLGSSSSAPNKAQ
jgi:hypothetical protein